MSPDDTQIQRLVQHMMCRNEYLMGLKQAGGAKQTYFFSTKKEGYTKIFKGHIFVAWHFRQIIYICAYHIYIYYMYTQK